MCLILNSDSEFARNSYVKAQLQNGRQSLEGDKESNKPIGFRPMYGIIRGTETRKTPAIIRFAPIFAAIFRLSPDVRVNSRRKRESDIVRPVDRFAFSSLETDNGHLDEMRLIAPLIFLATALVVNARRKYAARLKSRVLDRLFVTIEKRACSLRSFSTKSTGLRTFTSTPGSS